MTDETRYCRDCKHIDVSDEKPLSEVSLCLHPKALEHFPNHMVTGEAVPSVPRHARVMRALMPECGAAGLLFEARG